jgi:hypothetical protein
MSRIFSPGTRPARGAGVTPIRDEDVARFRRDGFHAARGLVPRPRVELALAALDQLLCARDPSLRPSPPARVADEIHDKLTSLAARDRAELGRVYAAARKVAPFWGLVGSAEINEAAGRLLETSHVGVAFRGAGIRLDLPHEDRYRSHWHQEYHSQMSSLRGVVAWISLGRVDSSMGPVELAVGSHREGLLPVRCVDPMNVGRDYTRTFVVPDVESVAARYPSSSFATEPGDVLFLDFLLLHRSGWNRSAEGRSRVTGQVRYFDMTEPTGVAHAWLGGWQDGGDFAALHPDKVVS